MKPAALVPLLLLICMGQTRPSATASAPATKPSDPPSQYYNLTPEQFFNRPETHDRYSQHVLNVALLEAAVFQQSNIVRKQHNLPAFQSSFALQLMARRHSEEMAKLHYFSHTSPTPGSRLLVDRLRNVGLANVSAAENIAVLPAREIGSGHFVIHLNADGTESWTDARTGKPIQFDTYQEFAAGVLDEWMNSPEHRANLLNREYAYLGVGVARGAYGEGRQDSVYATQDFSSQVVPASEVKAEKELAGKEKGSVRGRP